MTISLVIDTSTSRTLVGVADDQRVIFEQFHEGATDHGRALTELVANALSSSPLPEQVIVGIGPGPYTGLRVGISFAQTFALARSITWIGICSLDAINIGQDSYTVATDARRKEIYWASYKSGVRIAGPSVDKPENVPGHILGKYPDVASFIKLSTSQNIRAAIYLRRPDAIETALRP